MTPDLGDFPVLRLNGSKVDISSHFGDEAFLRTLSAWIVTRRWFASKSRTLESGSLTDVMELTSDPLGGVRYWSGFLSLTYLTGEPESYFLPLAFSEGGGSTADPVVRLVFDDGAGILEDALMIGAFGQRLLSMFGGGHTPFPLFVQKTSLLSPFLSQVENPVLPRVLSGEQSNTSLLFGQSLIMKCYRRPENGGNCDLDMGVFFSERSGALPTAPLLGAIGQALSPENSRILALLSGFVPNQGDAWNFFLRGIDPEKQKERLENGGKDFLDSDFRRIIAAVGEGTARLHRVLSEADASLSMVPESTGKTDLMKLKSSIVNYLGDVFPEGARVPAWWPEGAAPPGELSRSIEQWTRKCLERLLVVDSNDWGMKIRCHGDYHLGQLLVTPDLDIVVIDFEGEPSVPLDVRREKMSPLSDVAGMIRSFHYLSMAIFTNVRDQQYAKTFFARTSGIFLESYRTRMQGSPVLPEGEVSRDLLDLYLLRKALYELSYEMNNRPSWCRVPLSGILDLIAEGDV